MQFCVSAVIWYGLLLFFFLCASKHLILTPSYHVGQMLCQVTYLINLMWWGSILVLMIHGNVSLNCIIINSLRHEWNTLLLCYKDKLVNAVYCENHTKPINILCGQNAEFLNIKAGSTSVRAVLSKANLHFLLASIYRVKENRNLTFNPKLPFYGASCYQENLCPSIYCSGGDIFRLNQIM
jgi:hypothetical protein